MKKSAGFLVLMTILVFSVQAQNKTKIQGSFTGDSMATTITLENFLNPGAFGKDITITDKKFSFEFDLDREDIFKLKFSQQNYLALVIKPGDKITLTLNPDAIGVNPKIDGSSQSARIYSLENNMAAFKKMQDSLSALYSATLATDADKKKQIENEYNMLEAQKSIILSSVISDNIGDLVNLFFIERLEIDQYYPLYEKVDSAIYEKYKYNQAVESLHTKIASGKATAVGSVAPEIKLPTPEGEMLSLYSIKGKVIIIDFWASWCRPCRMENPNMTKLYADFHDKGLEIFGVSLDKDKAAWIKAIADDKLIWKHVSDLKYWQSEAAKLYGVGSIPSMFVLDGEYKIIAKNLRGEQLRAFVASKLN